MASPSTQTPGRPQTEKTTPRDFRQEVTDSIVQMLEKGVAPWQKPWEPGAGSLSMPFNPTSERAYRGGNAIHLMTAGLRNGYDDPRWLTYKQAADQGWQIRKGEKGTQNALLFGRRHLRIPPKVNAIPKGSRTQFRDDPEYRSERSDAGSPIVQ